MMHGELHCRTAVVVQRFELMLTIMNTVAVIVINIITIIVVIVIHIIILILCCWYYYYYYCMCWFSLFLLLLKMQSNLFELDITDHISTESTGTLSFLKLRGLSCDVMILRDA